MHTRLSAVSGPARAAALLCLFCPALLAGCSGGGGTSVAPPPPSQNVCEPGQVLDESDNSCGSPYWNRLQSHQYVSGVESPQQQAFQAAGAGTGSAVGTGRAYLIDGGEQGRRVVDLLARIGVSSAQFTYLGLGDDLDAGHAGDLVSRYAYLTAADFVNLSFSALPFVAADDRVNHGVTASQVENGAYMLLDTGDDGSVDPLARLPAHFRAGTRQAAATGKLHFYYGLDQSLAARDSRSSGCKNVQDYCIGAPYQFQVELGSGATVALTGAPSAFAFATYLLAWERMPARTHISAVFTLALSCVEDIGAANADDETGLGRLDLGCLAYGVTQAAECSPGQILVGSQCQELACPAGTAAAADRGSCAPVAYWSDIQGHSYLPGNESAHQKAFEAIGFAGDIVDRSDDAHIVDGGAHGQNSRDLLFRIGVPDANYSYHALSVSVSMDGRTLFQGDDLILSYYSLASSDLVNFSIESFFNTVATVGVESRHVEDGAWVVQSAGNGGAEDWLALLTVTKSEGVKQAVATGKVHFYYGLDSTLVGRHAGSNGCKDIEEHCIGAPFEFQIQLRDNISVTLTGTSFSAPFGFAAYLLAWERMPARTHISAVFDLARSCVEDIGGPGADAATGLGRLDIGCMAYGATRAGDCGPGYQLVSMTDCEKFSYWDDMKNIFVISGDDDPVTRAFKDVGLADRRVDRSAGAVLIANDGLRISIVNNLKITATVNYQFVQFNLPATRDEYASVVMAAYGRLDASSFIGLVHSFDVFTSDQGLLPGINAAEISAGARLVVPVGNFGQIDPLVAVLLESQIGVRQAINTGKVHFFYGLNDELTGRNHGDNDGLVPHNAESDGCQHIKMYCLGLPYTYFLQPPGSLSLRYYYGTGYSAAFGFAAYLLTWERMPQSATIADVFSLALSCAEDLGEDGPDDETGLGRLDLGCLAYGAYRAGNPVSSASSLSAPAPPGQGEDAAAYMDGFAQDLFGDRLGYLGLPGAASAKVQVGFPGDSFAGSYRPVLEAEVYRSGPPDPRHLPLQPGFGLVAAGGQVGAYYQALPGLRAGVLAGRGESFFGGRGSREFAFSCTTDVRLLLSAQVRPDADSRLGVSGWLGESRAGCIRGRLLDGLRGREGGLAAFYSRQAGRWRLQAQAWGARFAGGEVTVAGQPFAIAAGSPSYGARVQVSYSF